MKYKVCNLERDMKLLQNGSLVTIKRGESRSVSVQDYQYLAQVYGMAVKGEKEYIVRITKPAEICECAKIAQVSVPEPVPAKKRKNKKK